MDKDKELGYEGAAPKEEFTESSSRARNRTVMLTPEMTSQVRSRFQQEHEGSNGSTQHTRPAPHFESHRPTPSGGYDTGGAGAGYYVPGTPSRQQQAEPVAAAPAYQAPSAPIGHSAGEGINWMKESPVVGFLVSYDSNPNGSVFELRTGRLIVTNQPSSGENTLVLSDSTVSSMHAIIRVGASGEIQVLDQLSEFGTKIKRFESEEEETLSGEKSTVEHGDLLSFGSRHFYVCLVPRGARE